MRGRRSQHTNLLPIDHEIERTLKDLRRQQLSSRLSPKKMGGVVQHNDQVPPLNNNPPPPQPRSMRDYTAPKDYTAPTCLVLTPITQHFEIRPAIIQLLPNYYGKENENPYKHVKDFFNLCSTFNYIEVDIEQIRLRLFPFSLKDKAQDWFDSS